MTNPSTILKTIGNPHRLEIIKVLMNGECNVSTINRIVHVSQPALSQGLKKLKDAGIIAARRDSREIYYHIKNPHVIRIIGIAEEMSEVA